MPRKCCMYACKSNYKSTEVRYSVFCFSCDKTLRREWIRKIPNANFNPRKYTCVCEKHFTVEDVSRFHVIGDKVSTVIYIYIFILCVLYTNIIILFITYTFRTNKQKCLKRTHGKNKKI